MEKEVLLDTQTDKGVFLYTIAEGRDKGYLEKNASASYHPEIAKYIRDATPILGKTQILLTALGAGEFWGSNSNGDFFPETALKNPTQEYGYKTFERLAKVYRHHVNKQPDKASGDVALSVWNDRMKRVELIVIIEKAKAPDLVEKIDAGEYLPVSMGCLKGNALITMSDYSKKPVCEMSSGDQVLSGDGKVVTVDYPHSHKHEGSWYYVNVFGVRQVEPTTEEHPWRVLPKEQIACRGHSHKNIKKRSKCTPRSDEKPGCQGCSFIDELKIEPQWRNARDLTVGDHIGTPILSEQEPCPEEDLFVGLLGLYLTEGTISSDSYMSLTVHKKEVDRILKKYSKKWTIKVKGHPVSEHAATLTIYDKALAHKLLSYVGKTAHKKYISSTVMRWPKEQQLILLGEYLNGDGGVYKNSAYFSTCNERLSRQVQAMLLRCGVISSRNILRHKPSTIVKKHTTEYQVWCGSDTATILAPYTYKGPLELGGYLKEMRFIADGYLWSPITAIDVEDCDEEVFNIAIKSDDYSSDSYQVNEVALHNCRVPFDVCSVCGNRAKTRAQYCDHLRYHMNRVPPGHSKKACAINTIPKFFDISFVLIGADSIAKVLKKVASPLHLLHKTSGLKKAEYKKADITKRVPSNIKPETVKPIDHDIEAGGELLRANEPDMSKKLIIRISSGAPGMGSLNRLLSTLSFMGIMPKREEFQSMALRSLGKSNLADKYERNGTLFSPFTEVPNDQMEVCDRMLSLRPELFDNNIFNCCRHMMPERSYAKPLLNKRVIMLIKMAESGPIQHKEYRRAAKEEEKNFKIGLIPMMLTLTALYKILKKKAPGTASEGLGGLIDKYPGLAASIGVGTIAGVKAMTRPANKGKFDFDPEKGPIKHYNWQEDIHRKNRSPLIKSSAALPSKNAVLAASVFLGAPAAYMASGILEAKKKKNPYEKESFMGKIIRKNPGAVSLGLVASAYLGYPKATKMVGDAKAVFSSGKGKEGLGLLKKADGVLGESALFALAFPGKSIANRFVSNVVDHSIFKGVSKLLSKKQRRKPNANYR